MNISRVTDVAVQVAFLGLMAQWVYSHPSVQAMIVSGVQWQTAGPVVLILAIFTSLIKHWLVPLAIFASVMASTLTLAFGVLLCFIYRFGTAMHSEAIYQSAQRIVDFLVSWLPRAAE